jgi:hypothetical protein
MPVLDWRHYSHFADFPAACRYCGGDAHCRDDNGRPAHKVCAETALEQTPDTDPFTDVLDRRWAS